MKPIKLSFFILFFLFKLISNAQNESIKYEIKEFDKVQIEGVNGEIEIILGKPFAISVFGKENIQNQFEIFKAEDKLIIRMKSSKANNYQNNTKVKVEMPEISKLYNFSNADVSVREFIGRYLGIENKGNGNISVVGSNVDFIEIKNDGNGNINTKEIFSKKVDISKTGNGDVYIKTNSSFNVDMSGNGDIVNFGNGKAFIKTKSGTGRILNRNQ